MFVSGPVLASDDTINDLQLILLEEQLAQKINEARQNPVQAADSLGINLDEFFIRNPEVADAVAKGLPPLIRNPRLDFSAAEHSRDMVTHNFYAYESLDGSTLEQRLQNYEIETDASAEIIAIVAFINFMKPSDALDILYEKIIRRQLDSAQKDHCLFRPDLTEIGIGFETGSMVFEGRSYNVYVVTCDLAAALNNRDFTLSFCQDALLELINQARTRPLAVAEAFGLDPQHLDFPEIEDLLIKGGPPLVRSTSLYRSASVRSCYSLKQPLSCPLKSDGGLSALDDEFYWDSDQDDDFGIAFTGKTEAFFPLKTLDQDPETIVRNIFEKFFLSELDPAENTKKYILNPDFNRIGISFVFGTYLADDGSIQTGYLCCVDLGANDSPDPTSYLMGTVYQDTNNNSLYDPGEGLTDAEILFCPGGEAGELEPGDHLAVNEAGGFEIQAECPGSIGVYLNHTEIPEIIQVIETRGANVWLPLQIN